MDREGHKLAHFINHEKLKRCLTLLRMHSNRPVRTIALFLISTNRSAIE